MTDFIKKAFCEEDFEQMSWHDATIYAISFDSEKYEFLFDIDYIVNWVHPKENEADFKFWVAPATLIFRNVYDINLSLYSLDFQIQNIAKDNPVKPKNANHIIEEFEYDWTILTTNGEITFKSTGYNQYLRRSPILLDTQNISLLERGNVSFEKSVIA